MKGKPVKYTYHTSINWIGEKKGKLMCEGKPDILVACPPEFGGHPGIWSPEDFFLASVEICTMTTFLWFVNREGIKLETYQSNASGTAELVGHVFRFSSIVIKIKIGVKSEEDRIKVERVLKKLPRVCVVSKSIHTDVKIEADIFLS